MDFEQFIALSKRDLEFFLDFWVTAFEPFESLSDFLDAFADKVSVVREFALLFECVVDAKVLGLLALRGAVLDL